MRPLIAVVIVVAVAVLGPSAFGASVPMEWGHERPGSVIDPFIVNGQVAADAEFPHQVSLQRKQTLLFWSWNEHYCGGTLLNARWVLTAAHCDQGSRSLPLYAVAGLNNLKDKQNGQRVPVERVIVHEKYHYGIGPYDIALVRVAEPFQFGPWVRPASLPAANALPQGDATLSGWGYVSNGLFPATKVLHKMTAPLLDFETCNATISRILSQTNPWASSKLAETNICTAADEMNKSACSGDSGGPLVQIDGDLVTVVGTVSYSSNPCGRGGTPTVYTRVSAFIDWIDDKMQGGS